MEMLRDIPGYKAALKAVLKSQIQFLAEQLSSETDEETVILSASTADGSLCQLGSLHGKSFLKDKDDIQSQFSQHCLQKQWEPHTGRDEITSVIDTQPAVHQNIAETLSRDVALAESSFLDQPYTVSAIDVTKHGQGQGLGRKKRKGRSHDNSTVKSKKTSDLNESSEREENDQDEKMEQETETSVDNMTSNLDITGDSEHIEVPTEILETVVKTDDGFDDGNKVKVEPESDDGEGDNFDDGSFSSGDEKAESSFKEDKTPKLEVAEPEKGKKDYSPFILQPGSLKRQKKRKPVRLKIKSSSSLRITSTSVHEEEQQPLISLSTGDGKGKMLHFCEYCGNGYKSKWGLRSHVNSIHKQKFRFTCEVCGKGHNSLWNFRGHLRMHNEKLREKCDTCGKLFTYSSSLVTHKKDCGKKTEDDSKDLSITHYVCQVCGAIFKTKKSVKDHERGSHGNIGYKCQACCKIFRWRSSLSYHVKHVHQQ